MSTQRRRTRQDPMMVEILVDGKPLANTSPLDAVSEQPCWILLTAKLPTRASPPKLSIFWSQPWPLEEFTNRKNDIRAKLEGKGWRGEELESETRRLYDAHHGVIAPAPFGRNPDYLNARRISFDGQSIRVWSHEFSVLSAEKMRHYVVESGGYALMPEGAGGLGSTAKLIRDVTMDTDQKFVRDAALIDGCDEPQAILVALGHDVSEILTPFEPLGWYKLTDRESIETLCAPWEVKEHRAQMAPKDPGTTTRSQ